MMPCPFPVARLALLLLLAAATGCSPAARLHGKWEVDTARLQAQVTGEQKNPLAGLAAGLLSMFKVNLEFKADGTCSANVEALGQSKSTSGTWRFVNAEGDTLVISAKMEDAAAEQEVRVKFVDHDHVELAPPVSTGEARRAMPFVRVKAE